jgi:hypothetical protein
LQHGKARCLELGDGNAFHVANTNMVQDYGRMIADRLSEQQPLGELVEVPNQSGRYLSGYAANLADVQCLRTGRDVGAVPRP